MEAAFYLLLVIGHLGVFDVLYFHLYRCQLDRRPECHREVLWHTIRHFIYASQFLIIANLRFHGAALLILACLYAADVLIAWADVLEETASRRAQGGLPRGEYFMHIVLSLLVGCYLLLVAQTVWADRLLPAGVALDPPHVPGLLRAYMTLMGIGAFAAFFIDLYRWLTFHRRTQPDAAQDGVLRPTLS
jgi:hypothetical protein